MIKYFTFIFLAFISLTAAAQTIGLSNSDRERWIQEIRGYKHDYITKELDLTKDQQREFFPLYDAMEDEIERINIETRDLETKAHAEASDLELENAARTVFEQKRAEGQVEMTYFEKFRTILSPRQLLKLKQAERKFTQNLVKQHRRAKTKK